MIVSVKEVRRLHHVARNLVRAYWQASNESQLDEVGARMEKVCGWLYEAIDRDTASEEVLGKCRELLSWISDHTAGGCR